MIRQLLIGLEPQAHRGTRGANRGVAGGDARVAGAAVVGLVVGDVALEQGQVGPRRIADVERLQP